MNIPFIEARHYTKGRTTSVKFLVIHDMEAPESASTAENVARWFAGSNAPQASTHYNIDSDSIVMSVPESDTAWCAPGCNNNGIHLEHAGYARQSRAEWTDEYSTATLKLSAWLAAHICKRHGIEVRKGDYRDILAGRKCIVGHRDVTAAYPDKGSHSDPGPNFPWDWYIKEVQAVYGAIGGGGASAPVGIPSASHSSGELDVDGWLGPNTIRRWQEVMGTTPDGVISPVSDLVKAVQRYLNAHGVRDRRGMALKVDGKGIQSNEHGRYPAKGYTHTLEAVQRHLQSGAIDGYLSAPSDAIKVLQRRLNTNHF